MKIVRCNNNLAGRVQGRCCGSSRRFAFFTKKHTQNFPPVCHTTDGPYGLPNAEMEAYVSVDEWAATTALGGRYNWEGPDYYAYAGISVDGATADVKYFRHVDAMLDDGNLSSGNFREIDGRYTYIIDQ